MNDDAKTQLQTILQTYEQKLAEVARVDAANHAAALAFPERYAKLRSDTIRPAIQEFADVLNSRGHEVTVSELDESTSSEAGVTSATISLRIVPKAAAQKTTAAKKSFIELSFSANRNDRKVTVSSINTLMTLAGSVGKRAQYDVDEVTAQVIETHVLNALGEALATA